MTTPSTTSDFDYRRTRSVCDAVLWDYLQGKLDPAEALLVATHCNLSPSAHKRVTELNACASVTLETLEPVKMSCSAQEFMKKCCAAPKVMDEACKDKEAAMPVPKPLQKKLGHTCFEGVKWQNTAPGIAERQIKMCGSNATIKVMKIDQGSSVPEHTHTGDEMTLVLHGSFDDAGEIFKKGDVAFVPGDAALPSHAPMALEPCICMVVTEKTSYLSTKIKAFFGSFFGSPHASGA